MARLPRRRGPARGARRRRRAGLARAGAPLTGYRDLLALPGAAAFSAAGFAARLPMAMYPVGLVLLASLGTGDYARGGSLTAAFILGNAAGNPALSRAADLWGQRVVATPAACLHVAVLAALVLGVEAHLPAPAQVAAAAATGFTFLPAGAFVRARWAHLLARSPERLGTALSLESTAEEVIFVLGPVVTTVAATTVAPALPFGLIAVLVLGGSLALARLPRTAPPPHGRSVGPRAPLPLAATAATVLVAAAAGVTLVSVDLATIAYVGQAGRAPWTGAVLGCFALGSAVAGLAYGSVSWRRAVEQRLVPVAAVFALLPLLFLLTPGPGVLAVLMLTVGLGTAPLLITVFGVMQRVSPAGRATEALAWVTTGLSVGAGLASPLVGALAQERGGVVALRVPVVAALCTGLLAVPAARAARRLVA